MTSLFPSKVQKKGPLVYRPRAPQNFFCFGNPAIPNIQDPWLSVPRLLVVWLYRQSILKPFFLSKLWAILVPKEIECLNSLISKGLLESWNFMEEEKVTFFVLKNNYLVTIISLTYSKRFRLEMLCDETKMENHTFRKESSRKGHEDSNYKGWNLVKAKNWWFPENHNIQAQWQPYTIPRNVNSGRKDHYRFCTTGFRFAPLVDRRWCFPSVLQRQRLAYLPHLLVVLNR